MNLSVPENGTPTGTEILVALLQLAAQTLQCLQKATSTKSPHPFVALSRVRGSGRGVHFRDYVAALERDHPLMLRSPFEGSDLVAGAAWEGPTLVGPHCTAALAKLRWAAGADDLPIHVHDHSDRFIIVDKGRGYFHYAEQGIDDFNGTIVHSIPARERDVFIFSRGVVHTFSTADESMTLLSCQLPYLPFDDPHQFRLPRLRWTVRDNPEQSPPRVQLDPVWFLFAPVGS